MDCSCIYIDSDYPDLFDYEYRKARKIHCCTTCREEIKEKETYRYETCLYDECWSHTKICKDCESIIKTFFCNGYDDNLYDDLDEHIISCNGQISSEVLNKLTPNAKKYIINKIDQLWKQKGK